MSSVTFPVTRPAGRALIVAVPSGRSETVALLQRLGYTCAETDDPYSALLELCQRPLAYRVLVLSLSALYRQELQLIATVKRRFPHLEIWLTHSDGRQAALAEAIRLGGDGLLADDGFHRMAAVSEASSPAPPSATSPQPAADTGRDEPGQRETPTHDPGFGEPVLTADELRALLQEEPSEHGEQ